MSAAATSALISAHLLTTRLLYLPLWGRRRDGDRICPQRGCVRGQNVKSPAHPHQRAAGEPRQRCPAWSQISWHMWRRTSETWSKPRGELWLFRSWATPGSEEQGCKAAESRGLPLLSTSVIGSSLIDTGRRGTNTDTLNFRRRVKGMQSHLHTEKVYVSLSAEFAAGRLDPSMPALHTSYSYLGRSWSEQSIIVRWWALIIFRAYVAYESFWSFRKVWMSGCECRIGSGT